MAEGFNHFPQIADQLGKALSQVVRKTAFDLQAAAASNAPVDTSFLRNSIYVKTSQESTYGTGGGPTHKDSYLLPEVESPPDDKTAYVAAGANYSVYVEMGTRHMSAQPYLAPAADAVQPSFEAALSAIESQLGGN